MLIQFAVCIAVSLGLGQSSSAPADDASPTSAPTSASTTASPVAPAAPLAPADPAALARIRAYEQARIELIERLRPSVVCMFNKGDRAGGGSGVIIDPEGYGLTNFHVVMGMMDQHVGEGGLADHKIYPFDVLGIDPTGDVAMFKLERKEPFAAAPLGDSDKLTVGDYALAMGNPFLLAEDYTPTVTLGIISGLHRYQWGSGRALRYTDCIQVDTSINPGNSGGPLFDLAGSVIGINGRVSIEERGRVNVGVGYAISINQIKMFIPSLRAGIPTKHATAGFTVMDRSHGAAVNQILDDCEAYKAGLRLGDRIVQFGGKTITNANQFTSLLGIYPGGWPVDIVYQRENEKHAIRVRLEDLPFPAMSEAPPGAPKPPDPLRPHRVKRVANARAVKRALAMHEAACGGPGSFHAVRSLGATGRRTLTSRPEEPQELNLNEKRPDEAGPTTQIEPPAFEREIRWALFMADDTAAANYRVVGGDEVRGRICVVLERKADAAPGYRLAFDDENGRLLRVEFKDATSGKRVRYEYDDYRRSGNLKMPHHRWLYLDDVLFAEDVFDTVTTSSQVGT